MISKIIVFSIVSLLVYVAIALGLIFSQWPQDNLTGGSLDFSTQISQSAASPQKLQSFEARDGVKLGYRHYPSKTTEAPLLVFLHGSGWHGLGYDNLAQKLNAATNIEIIVPDLRGHGPDTSDRGDIKYIAQLEDDISDLIKKFAKPGQEIIIAGHSSGGGLAVRYFGGAKNIKPDRVILLAPFLKYNAPTIRPNSGGWAHVLTRRIIGLSMLNTIGITALNGLHMIQFNFPDAVLSSPLGKTATRSYSYRLNTGFAPRSDYLEDIKALPKYLLIAGRNDEAFIADNYEPLMTPVNAKGTFVLLDDTSHLGVIDKDKTIEAIVSFLGKK